MTVLANLSGQADAAKGVSNRLGSRFDGSVRGRALGHSRSRPRASGVSRSGDKQLSRGPAEAVGVIPHGGARACSISARRPERASRGSPAARARARSSTTRSRSSGGTGGSRAGGGGAGAGAGLQPAIVSPRARAATSRAARALATSQQGQQHRLSRRRREIRFYGIEGPLGLACAPSWRPRLAPWLIWCGSA